MHRGTTREASLTSSAVSYISVLTKAVFGISFTNVYRAIGAWA